MRVLEIKCRRAVEIGRIRLMRQSRTRADTPAHFETAILAMAYHCWSFHGPVNRLSSHRCGACRDRCSSIEEQQFAYAMPLAASMILSESADCRAGTVRLAAIGFDSADLGRRRYTCRAVLREKLLHRGRRPQVEFGRSRSSRRCAPSAANGERCGTTRPRWPATKMLESCGPVIRPDVP